ncbi:MAG: OprO/OprP family phosphate-selective porin [Prevotellaceae bacterium]|jgi:phosphate-selective porin|nr:OprO/OprP family phosphate-selective porin [Prevotellaceae bacterium]
MKRGKNVALLMCLGFAALTAPAQESVSIEQLEQRTANVENAIKVLQKLKISGYVQAQYQWGEKDASLKVGSANENSEESFDRFGVRRGRIKFAYEDGWALGVFQLDVTEKGVGFKDAYFQIKDPFLDSGSSLKAGIFDRPFGYEIGYSSSRRESPERSTVFQTLFPDERDLGAMLTLQTGKNSPLNFLKLEAGLFAGNGIKPETDSRKDFIGHLSANKKLNSNISFAGGVSYYNGGVWQGNENVYTMHGKNFELNSNPNNKGEFAKREYVGFDVQFAATTVLGQTKLTGEYLFGQQPGTASSSKSPNWTALPTGDTFIRNFNGGYAMLVQDLGKLPVSAVLKYDFYDPNTEISGDAVTNGTDLMQDTYGFGFVWYALKNVRMQAYYEMVNKEKSDQFEGDAFTLRLEYKF